MHHSLQFSLRRRKKVTTAALTVAIASLSLSGSGPAAAAGASGQGSVRHHVALAGSYAVGTGLPQRTDAECRRSSGSYPS
ncbi:hypothetical protein ACF1AE_19270 [Streptomyces sp. NPDC014986]|uniref:hypothetical protein n=1 Tax=Streptomyces sp. NPDC014986 TaxID=3364934 RepID=UPI0036F77C2D